MSIKSSARESRYVDADDDPLDRFVRFPRFCNSINFFRLCGVGDDDKRPTETIGDEAVAVAAAVTTNDEGSGPPTLRPEPTNSRCADPLSSRQWPLSHSPTAAKPGVG